MLKVRYVVKEVERATAWGQDYALETSRLHALGMGLHA